MSYTCPFELLREEEELNAILEKQEQEIKDSLAEDAWDEKRHGLDRFVIDG